MTAASLTDHLSRWPDDRLRRLLTLRPDLCHPPVPDVAALAARAGTQISALRALELLDRSRLHVLEALAVLEHRPDAGRGAGAAGLAALLFGPDAGAERCAWLDDCLADLTAAALVLPAGRASPSGAGSTPGSGSSPGGPWQLPVAVATALGPHPLGLGRSAAVLDGASPGRPRADSGGPPSPVPTPLPRDREGILALLRREAADPAVAERAAAALDALQDSPVARLPHPPGSVHELLLRTGLLRPAGTLTDGSAVAEHPLEAGLAWRGGTAGPGVPARPPAPAGRPVSAALRRNAALAAITDLLRSGTGLLDALADGLPTLRSGGVGVRDLRRLADRTGADPEDTSWLLELLAAAGLLVLDPDTSRWVRAAEAVDWLRAERHVQWEALVLGWLRSGRAPMLGPVPQGPVPQGPVPAGTPGQRTSRPSAAGPPTAGAGPTPAGGGRALAPDRNRPDAPRLRAAVLETARALDEEHPGARLQDAVAARQSWHRPRQFARTAAFTAPLLAEAARLGLTGAGALTPAGALVAADRLDEAADAVGRALPAPVNRVRLQADLTAVAPGYLDPAVARGLAAMAEAEGDGAAGVYRFSDASVHRALDAGMDAAALERFLAEHSEDPLPQSLRYLIRDAARRHGALAVGAAGAWLRVEDPSVLDVLVADPALAAAGLERVAPTVAVAGVGQAELHRMLAAAGHRAALLRRTGPGDAPGSPAGITGDTAVGTTAGAATAPGVTGPPGSPAGADRARTPAARASALAAAFPEPVRTVRWTPTEEELDVQLARLRAAPRPVPAGPGTEEAVAVLRQAARRRSPVLLTTVDQRGEQQSQRVVPLAVAGGRLRALVPDREAETLVPLHRVVSAEDADD